MNRFSHLTKSSRWLPGWLLLVCCAWPLSAATLDLSQAPERLALGPWLQVHTSAAHAALPSELTAEGWQPLGSQHLNAGWSGDRLWLRLQLSNPGPASQRILQFSRANLAQVQLYRWQPDTQLGFVQAGHASKQVRGDVETPGYGFLLSLPPGESQFLLQLANHGPLLSPVYLNTPNAAFRHAQHSAAWFGAGLGAAATCWLLLAWLRRPLRQPRWPVLALATAGILYAMTDRGVFGSWWLAIAHAQPLFLTTATLLLSAAYLWLLHHTAASTTPAQRRQHSGLHVVGGLLLMSGLTSLMLPPHWMAWFSIGSPAVTLLLCTLLLCTRPGLQTPPLRHWLLITTGLHLLLTMNQLGWLLPATQAYQWFLLGSLLGMPWLTKLLRLSPTPETVDNTHPGADVDHPAPSVLPTTVAETAAVIRSRDSVDPASLAPMQHRILVVEDNAWVQQVLVGLLHKLGCQVDTAINGEIALDLQKRQHYDLVLMDCDMPVLDGVTATQLWRQHEQALRRTPTPILAVTAHVSADKRQLALDAGMNDFLAKPVDLRLLRQALLNWIPQAATSGQADRTS